MELQELFNLIQRTLSKQGFKLTTLLPNTYDMSRFVLDTELERRQVSEIANYQAFYGNCIEVRRCPHRNGSKQDISYYVAIEDVDRSSFRDYKKIKLQRVQTEPTLINKITRLTLEYKQYIHDKQIEKEIDKLLG